MTLLEIVDDIGDVVNVVNDVRTYVLNVVVLLLYCFKCRTPGRVPVYLFLVLFCIDFS